MKMLLPYKKSISSKNRYQMNSNYQASWDPQHGGREAMEDRLEEPAHAKSRRKARKKKGAGVGHLNVFTWCVES